MERKTTKTHKSQTMLLLLVAATVSIVALTPLITFADPHAMFYTDRGQEQVFYNVLAALNQADYVEPPASPNPYGYVSPPQSSGQAADPPYITSDYRMGNYIASGNYQPDPVQRTVDANGNLSAPLEPQERDTLPRLRVRQVTSDNGDAFFREQMLQRSLLEEMRVILSKISCTDASLIYGPQEAKNENYCPPE